MPPNAFLDDSRLLLVQSHVVSGYVGNRAATFPLQLLGYDVDVINTVQFSNHTGYGHTNGHKTTPEQLELVFSGLETNGLCRWSRCLTGYIPGAEALQVVGQNIEKLRMTAKQNGEQLLYLLDPVMGDIGKGLYVAEDVVPIYRGMLHQASIITPNQFEAELLSETKITSLDALHKALKILHSPPYNVPHVVISSIPLPLSLIKKLDLPTPPKSYTDLLPPLPEDVLHGKRPALSRQGSVDDEAEGFREKLSSGIKVFHTEGESMGMGGKEEPTVLVCFASTNINAGIPGKEVEMKSTGYALPTVQGYYSGVGDLFSALVLGHYKSEKEGGEGLERAVALALLGVQQVLLQTHLFTLEEKKIKEDGKEEEQSCIPSDDELDSRPPTPAGKKARLPEPSRKAKRMRMRELKIVQERGLLMQLGSGGEKGWTGKTLDWQGLIG